MDDRDRPRIVPQSPGESDEGAERKGIDIASELDGGGVAEGEIRVPRHGDSHDHGRGHGHEQKKERR